MLDTKCFLISVAVEYDDSITIYTSTRKAFTAEEAKFMLLHTLQTEYAPSPDFNAQEDTQILSCEQVDMMFADAIVEGIA